MEGHEEDTAEFTASLDADPRGAALRERERSWLAANGVHVDGRQDLGRPPLAVVFTVTSMQPNADGVDESVCTFVGPARSLAAEGSWPAPPDGHRLLLISLGTAFTDRPEFSRRTSTSSRTPTTSGRRGGRADRLHGGDRRGTAGGVEAAVAVVESVPGAGVGASTW